MALTDATAKAARQMDALASAIARVTTAATSTPAARTTADRALADLFKRGLAPEAVVALKKALGIR